MKALGLSVLRAALAVCALPSLAFAQRATENVVATAQDAFGTSIGNESIGLYSQNDARGFSPKDAGNFRIEGLYYDQQGNFGFGNQISSSTAIRVGLSAQSYPFPAPTGIADIRLRLPRGQTQVSANAYYGPYGKQYGGQVDLETPLIPDKLGTVLSVSGGQKDLDFHSVFSYTDLAGTFHLTPNDTSEIIALGNYSAARDGESPPLIFTAGAFLPPRFDHSHIFGPDFYQKRDRTQGNFGLIGRTQVSENWRLQAALFRSFNNLEGDYAIFYRNTQPSGLADLAIRANAPPKLGSYSGEVRASGTFVEGNRRHTIHLAARGRMVDRTFGGDQTVATGPAMIGVVLHMAKPAFTLGPQSNDDVRQGTAGVSYVAQWAGIGEVSAGLQKSSYRRSVAQPALPLAASKLSPWLYNGTVAAYVNDAFSVFASYTRGLEESGIAPLNASNPGEALPASLTEQIDAGLRYRLAPGITLMAGVFEVKKPYFDRDATNLFTQVGALSHRGVEMSLSGEPVKGLKIVAGGLLLKARVSGFTVDRGLIGPIPPGRPPAVLKLNVNYAPAAWKGFSLNGQVNYEDGQQANRANTLRIPAATVLDVGARYDFKLRGASASLRLDVRNITDLDDWTVNGSSGQFSPTPSRRYGLRFAVDY